MVCHRGRLVIGKQLDCSLQDLALSGGQFEVGAGARQFLYALQLHEDMTRKDHRPSK